MNHTSKFGAPPQWQYALIFVVALVPPTLWASSIIAAKVVVASVPPFTAAAARFLMASVMLWGLRAVLKADWQRPLGSDWVWLSLTGFFQTSLYFAFQYTGVEYTTAGNAAVIVNIRPIFVAILALFLLNEQLTHRTVAAILLAFAGVLVITSQGSLQDLRLSSAHFLGDMLIVLNALSGAVGLVLTKKVLGKFNPLSALLYTIPFGALGLLPLAAVEIARAGGLPLTTWTPWLLLVYQAVFCSLVAHFLWNNVLARMEASRTAVFLYVTPIVGVILAHFLLGEAITGSLLIGAVLVLAGTYQVAQPRRSPKRAAI